MLVNEALPLTEAGFWEMIRAARAGETTVKGTARALEAALGQRSPEDLIVFDGFVWAYYMRLDRKELWAAASVIGGGCSDDGFDYFREWLILQGKDVVMGAGMNPDSLADLPLTERARNEGLLFMARRRYEARLRRPFPEDAVRPSIDVRGWPEDRVKDYAWTKATTARLFPRLTAKRALQPPPL